MRSRQGRREGGMEGGKEGGREDVLGVVDLVDLDSVRVVKKQDLAVVQG